MEIDRYHRQTLLPQIGRDGQEKLRAARVLVVGVGALGSHIAEQLVRAGVGSIRIVDRDIVELTNLQRQALYTEYDVEHGIPKALAAAERLAKLNSEVAIDPRVLDVDSTNIEQLLDGITLILDGTDNVETRYLLNDISIKHSIPWVYGGCIGVEGRVMTILPSRSACLRCLFPDPPKGSELPTCDTAGVLGSAVAIVASLQTAAAIKLITGATVIPQLLTLDVWSNRFHAVDTLEARRPDCPCCGQRRFEFLDARKLKSPARLCGRDAVQVSPGSHAIDLDAVRQRLANIAKVDGSRFFLRAALHDPAGIVMTIFSDGRAIVSGTSDEGRARSLYSRFVGA